VQGHLNIVALRVFELIGTYAGISNLIFDYYNGRDLYFYVLKQEEARQQYPESLIWWLFRQMASALAFVHE
jgi:serine/threonine protein kinase